MPTQLSDRLLSWASILEPKTANQAHTTSKMPFIAGHVALMPDAHLGLGATVGSVIPTKGAIMPAAVGVDIGCGMIAVKTTLNASDLPDDLGPLLSRIEKVVPAGVGRGHEESSHPGGRYWQSNPSASVTDLGEEERAIKQFGTLGSGNHFLELCLEDNDTVWMVVHSGSRGIGNILARRHIQGAKDLMRQMFIHLDDPDLAYFVQGTAEFASYIDDLLWAQRYALANRERMMDAALAELRLAVNKPGATETLRVNCHHNYAAQENHRGHNIWVTRKGAISAREGQLGVIPGSMGTNTFIVTGKGNPASYTSAPHGAGRVMSRTQAKRELTEDSLTALMGDRTWLSTKAKSLVDEHPHAYKDINVVMRDSADLVEVETELHQILNYKGA